MVKPSESQATAYLMVELATDVPVPFVRKVCIASQPSTSMTAKPGTYFEYMRVEGKSYDEASRRLYGYVRQIDDLRWMLQYLDPPLGSFDGDRHAILLWCAAAEEVMRAMGGQVQYLLNLALRVTHK
ncbi:hypothetical protein HY632_04180 [Candidatus Uhrbacteria bacterium]|nr:hypothetical protein [Candidatus Uhrbacteria bacterium]